jgi:GTPase SAR1 family protein
MIEKKLGFHEYKIFVTELVNIYDSYQSVRGDYNDGINIVLLDKKIKNIVDNIFYVAIAGEVKAGKSTFLNSLLREEILPADVLQATSSIIEVFYSKRPFLKITYASGRVEEIEEESKEIFKERLKEVAAIPDEYRDIPTSVLDQWLLDHGEIPEVNDEFIRYLEEKSNLDNLSSQVDKIRSYLQKRNLDNITTRIELGYPFRVGLENIHFLDMPGVNAVGGVYDIAFSYLDMANAILFIHPIKPVESESFKNFVSTIIPKKNKDMVFQVLTHAVVYFEEKDRLLNEARRIYANLIPSNRIFAVDSILKLIHEDLMRGKKLEDIKRDKAKRKWVAFVLDLADELGIPPEKAFLEFSGFKELLPALENFMIEAPILELRNIAQTIHTGYEELERMLNEHLSLLLVRQKDLEKFEEEVKQRIDGYKRLQTEAYFILEEAEINFKGLNSPFERALQEFKSKYQELIVNSRNLEELRKHYRDAEDELDEIIGKSLSTISGFFQERLKVLGESLHKEYKLTIPKIDFAILEESTKKKLKEKEEKDALGRAWSFLLPWRWLKLKEIFKFKKESASTLEKKLMQELKGTAITQISNVLDKIRDEIFKALDYYKGQVKQMLKEKEAQIERLRLEIRTAEALELEILQTEKKLTMIQREKERLNRFLENLNVV